MRFSAEVEERHRSLYATLDGMGLQRARCLPMRAGALPAQTEEVAPSAPGPAAEEPQAGALIPSRDLVRSRRKREVRARTVSIKRMTKRELELGRMLNPDEGPARPTNRSECRGGERPCPFVSCVHHLYLDVSERTGAIKLNFPDIEPDELEESCALDVADRGAQTLERVGELLNLTRERIRQLEQKLFPRVRPLLKALVLDEEDAP